jgi:hypothetical protein
MEQPMGYGFLCQPLNRQRKLSSHTHEQHRPTHVEYGKPTVPDAI